MDVLIAVFAATALAQAPVFRPPDALAPEFSGPANLGFENGEPGKLPAEWSLAQESRIAGYSVEVSKVGCHSGKSCAVVAAGPRVEKGNAGVLVQPFSAVPFQGKRMRLSAWVRLEGGARGDRIKVAFTTDGEYSSEAFVQKGGVNSAEWTLAAVEGKVPWHADEIHIAITVSGLGRAWIDDVSFQPAGR